MSDLVNEIVEALKQPMRDVERERLETLLGQQRRLEKVGEQLKALRREFNLLTKEDPDLLPDKSELVH